MQHPFGPGEVGQACSASPATLIHPVLHPRASPDSRARGEEETPPGPKKSQGMAAGEVGSMLPSLGLERWGKLSAPLQGTQQQQPASGQPAPDHPHWSAELSSAPTDPSRRDPQLVPHTPPPSCKLVAIKARPGAIEPAHARPPHLQKRPLSP